MMQRRIFSVDDFVEEFCEKIVKLKTHGMHWNNDQCTIFTVVYYYKNEETLGHGSIAILSDEL